MHASLPRVWENVHDWEHLPWLHRSTFCSIDLLGSGAWDKQALVGLQPAEADRRIEIEVELFQLPLLLRSPFFGGNLEELAQALTEATQGFWARRELAFPGLL